MPMYKIRNTHEIAFRPKASEPSPHLLTEKGDKITNGVLCRQFHRAIGRQEVPK